MKLTSVIKVDLRFPTRGSPPSNINEQKPKQVFTESARFLLFSLSRTCRVSTNFVAAPEHEL